MVPGSPGKTPLRNILPAHQRPAGAEYLHLVDWPAEGVEAPEGHDVAPDIEGGAALPRRGHLPPCPAPLAGLNNRKYFRQKYIIAMIHWFDHNRNTDCWIWRITFCKVVSCQILIVMVVNCKLTRP